MQILPCITGEIYRKMEKIILEKTEKELVSFEKPQKLMENEINKFVSQAKSERGLLLGLIQKFSKDARKGKTYSAKELEIVFSGFLNKFNELESVGISKVNSWKGKSGIIKLIKKPDKIILFRIQKPNKDSEPKEVKIEITKEEINAVIVALNKLFNEKPIKTKDIAMIFSRELNLKHEDWERFFADRFYHNKLTNILDVLDSEGLIHYSGGLTNILKQKLEIQMIL